MNYYYFGGFILLSLLVGQARQDDSSTEDEAPEPDAKAVEQTLMRALELHRSKHGTSTSQTTKRPLRIGISPHDTSAEKLLDAIRQVSLPPSQPVESEEEEEVEDDDIVVDPDWCPDTEVLKLANRNVDLKTMKNILELRAKGRPHDKIQKLYAWYNRKYIPRFQACVEKGYKRIHVYRILAANVFKIFSMSREKGLPVRGYKLREWARREARKLDLPRFIASKSWLDRFKLVNRIRSRKVTKVVSQNFLDRRVSDSDKMSEFREKYLEWSRYFKKKMIFNVDQTGFNLEQTTDRTLSHQGERDTLLHAKNRNKQTHSYTSQPVISRSGHVVGKITLVFKEPKGSFGVRVAKKVEELEQKYKNIKVYAGSTHIITNDLMRQWAEEVFVPAIDQARNRSSEDDSDEHPNANDLVRGYNLGLDDGDEECYNEVFHASKCPYFFGPITGALCYISSRQEATKNCTGAPEGIILYDSYAANRQIGVVARPEPTNIKSMVIPERATSELQPLDVLFNRQYKIFVARITEQAHYDDLIEEITSREGIINMHSLVWDQLNSPHYRDMNRWCWHKTDLDLSAQELTHQVPLMVRAIQFAFNETTCAMEECQEHPFIRCSHCGKVLCLKHFIQRICDHGDDMSGMLALIDRRDALRMLAGFDDDADDEILVEESAEDAELARIENL